MILNKKKILESTRPIWTNFDAFFRKIKSFEKKKKNHDYD